MKKLGTRGFTVVEGLLIFVIVAIIGGTGYYVYNKVKNDNTDKPLSDVSQQIKKQEQNKQNENSQEDEKPVSTKYLEVPEYGVKVELSTELSGAYYKIKNTYPYLSVHYLDRYEFCNISKEDGGEIAAISKAKVGDDHFGSPFTKAELEKVSSLKIGETYYWIELGNGGSCSDPSGQKPDPKEMSIRKAFSKAKLYRL